ncbi:MAG TPA: electron transport complex subunit RsxC [Termitinemataceae bacterium]|mgnify:CR=1 FL=1|uniref:electron transport complex subunit RsxC n=1 Tax=Treponema sp. J25 TaxID=2094121 RepID=UPI0010463456|nr:electron transport complex subunit RsxC [Treponema sp. J25]TCW61553.1 electron transport complex subunit RsxC [Treponema sp. J25]HOJ99291.1 electron transport complex subunit RsxC [Termitinemataceae bacterium]HOM24323.1 electron transport complex subunit RsxC [Termitinemataceae bacterium]HPQ00663.1 electron transport complex subunit RsxC [Termitinemataceae bacterium]
MAIKTFKGGIHPPERKVATSGKVIQRIPSPAQVVIPINQHFGAPNKPLVQVGDTVKRGQKIADGASPGPMTVPVHASISGIVKKIEPRTQSNNTEGLCIVIEANGSQEEAFMPPLDGLACSKEEALQRIREAGLVGMGGAGFPVHVKLNPPPNKPISLVIANGAECEPYLTIDEATMIEEADKVVQGLLIVMNIVGVDRGVIALEDNKERALTSLQEAIARHGKGKNIQVQLLKTKYPQGGEKMLITAITGKEVPSGGLPMDVGCVVQNVGTLKAIAEAFYEGKPLIERGLTVTGGACKTPKDIIAPIGTLVSDIPSSEIELDEEHLAKVIFGGPMMGTAVPHLGIPIQKNTSGVVFMTREEFQRDNDEEGPCIRCGRCIRACACRLSPVIMNIALKTGDLEAAARIGLLDCIECGACTYVCPAHIQLVQRFRVGKQLLRNKRAKEAALSAK